MNYTIHYIKRLDADELGVTGIVVALWNGHFQRRYKRMIDFDIIGAVLSNRILFGQADAAVFDGRKHGRWDIDVVR